MEKEVVPLTLMRRKIVETVTNSKQNIPHFYVQADVDMSRVIAAHKSSDESKGEKPSVNHYILRAVAMALKEVPELNVSYTPKGILKYKNVNLGFAVAMDGGIVIPVIRNAEKLNLQEISLVARDLVKRARSKKLLPQDYSGGTFTVSNMGMLGVKAFAAIIPPSQAAILAVGTTENVPRWIDSSWRPVPVASMVLSLDHRVADGALAAQFMRKLQELLRNPDILA